VSLSRKLETGSRLGGEQDCGGPLRPGAMFHWSEVLCHLVCGVIQLF
jgi:hypothetical protein